LVLYSFIPKPAREVWKKLFRKTERVVWIQKHSDFSEVVSIPVWVVVF
jgi:hypothetical protein